MGPLSYMRFIVDRNVVMRRIPAIHDTKPTKCTKWSLRYLYHNMALNMTTYFGPQGTVIQESNQNNAAR